MYIPLIGTNIRDIPSETFEMIIKELLADGWRMGKPFWGVAGSVDYHRVKLRKGFRALLLEYDNWTEGELTGNKKIVTEIAKRHNLKTNRFLFSI